MTEGVSAEEASSTMSYAATVNPVLSIALTDQIAVEFTPTTEGDFKNATAMLKVSTNNIDGYKIMLATNGDFVCCLAR